MEGERGDKTAKKDKFQNNNFSDKLLLISVKPQSIFFRLTSSKDMSSLSDKTDHWVVLGSNGDFFFANKPCLRLEPRPQMNDST